MKTDRIQLVPCEKRVRVWFGNLLLAETRNAMELHEKGYPVRFYVPRNDVNMAQLSLSDTTTHCPFKGDTRYYSCALETDIAWSYETPNAAMQAIAGALCFDQSCTFNLH